MKYYPEDSGNYMEYIEIPNDASDLSLILKMKDSECLVQMNNFCREVKQEISDQVKTTLQVGVLQISVKLAKNDTYPTFFQMMEQNHIITPQFYDLLYKAHQDRVITAQSASFSSPFKANSNEKPAEVSTSSFSFNLK